MLLIEGKLIHFVPPPYDGKNKKKRKPKGFFLNYVTFSPSRSVRCVTNKPPAMRVRDEGYTKKTP
ncbi:hypothetical protein, partial [Streptococcus suis]|uniref:hypothetical protein n=1 Tax=Streptococcus suis TaxID=1307 RepID=UPI001EE97740